MENEKKAIEQYHDFQLTKFEIEERKNLLLKELDNKEILESDLEEYKKRYQSLIKTSDLTVEKLRTSIKTGSETVRVEIYYNVPVQGEKTIIREDNHEEIIEDMTSEEMKKFPQLNLFNKNN